MVTTKTSKKPATGSKAATVKRAAKAATAPKSKTTASASKKTAAKKASPSKSTTTKTKTKAAATAAPSAAAKAGKPKAASGAARKSTTRTAATARAAKAKAGSATRSATSAAAADPAGWTPDAEVVFTPDWEPPTEDQIRKVKTGLTKKDLEGYRSMLIEKRAEVIHDVLALEGDALGEAGNLSHMPLHMADIGSDNYEQEFSLNLAQSERKMLIEINEALARIDRGLYGVCLYSGKPIGKPRLEAKPWAKYSIEVVRELEKRGRV